MNEKVADAPYPVLCDGDGSMEGMKPLLMIVDDDVTNLKALEHIFTAKYRINLRKSGEAVLNYFAMLGFFQEQNAEVATTTTSDELDRKRIANTPDLIVLDIMMPGIDGYAVCARLKEDPVLASIPVIFLTGKIEEHDVTRGFATGAVDYVTKPFNVAELQARVATHLALKSVREGLALKNRQLEQKIQELAEQTEKVRQKDTQLLMMDRIAGIGTLAAGIAHEINNPLGVIKSSLSGLKTDCAKIIAAGRLGCEQKSADAAADSAGLCLVAGFQGAVENKFARIDRGIDRISTIINSLLRVSRIDREKVGSFDINASINDVVGLLTTAEKMIRFDLHLTDIPLLQCIPNEINQCLLHLLRNAIDAVGSEGVITIRTIYEAAQNLLSILISDNGEGMTEEVRRRAFNPFFTTKPVGSGTGVGLTIVEQIVVKHHGRIELMSKEGEGTTVYLSLPVAHE